MRVTTSAINKLDALISPDLNQLIKERRGESTQHELRPPALRRNSLPNLSLTSMLRQPAMRNSSRRTDVGAAPRAVGLETNLVSDAIRARRNTNASQRRQARLTKNSPPIGFFAYLQKNAVYMGGAILGASVGVLMFKGLVPFAIFPSCLSVFSLLWAVPNLSISVTKKKAAGETNITLRPVDSITEEDALKNLIGMDPLVDNFCSFIDEAQRFASHLGQAKPNLMLHGAPGTGKTSVARAVAWETGYLLFHVRCDEMKSKYVNESEEMMQNVFRQLHQVIQKTEQPVLLFLDEIESLLPNRKDLLSEGKANGIGAAAAVGFLLEKLDGVENKPSHPLIVIGATNIPDVLDEAVMRRFPFTVETFLPDQGVRQQALAKITPELMENCSAEETAQVARMAAGLSVAYLKICLARAKLNAELQDRPVRLEDFKSLIAKVQGEVKRKQIAQEIWRPSAL